MPDTVTLPNLTILLAEDSDDIRYLLKMVLEMKGCRVLEAADGQQALERAPQLKPDLILMDLNMPVLDGWEATRRLRQMAEMQGTPIIGLSAHCQGEWYQEAIAAGCEDCIQKPIDNEALDKILSRFSKT